ncbi:effector-associated constant component EACC1 [Streptomyces sp. NPDC003042]
MEFEILSAGREDDDELRSLRAWLREDPELRGAVIWEADRDEPGTMGSVLEAVHVIVTDAAAFGSFAVSLAAWLGTRRSRSWRIRRDGRDGELPAAADEAQVRAALGDTGDDTDGSAVAGPEARR